MKNKMKTEKEFGTVKVFRENKDKISKEIKGMTFEQLNVYLENSKLKTQNEN